MKKGTITFQYCCDILVIKQDRVSQKTCFSGLIQIGPSYQCTMAKFQWEVRHSEFWTLPLILSASKYFRLISLSLYPHPNISDKFLCHFIFVEDKMNNQPYLFHSRKTKTKRRYGKWKWNYKSDIWPPCIIKKIEVKYLLNNFSE